MLVIQALRRKFLMTGITTIIMLQIANISIDPADPNPGNEDLSINDIESCVEFILEIVMDKSDAIEESDEQDEQTRQPNTTIILFASETAVCIEDRPAFLISCSRSNNSTSFFNSLTIPITSPPPKYS
jgi:hypothetical protein